MPWKLETHRGFFNSNLSKGNYELYFQTMGVIKDVDRLKDLFKLIVLLLNALALVGSADKEGVSISLVDKDRREEG